jgi:hypothetical protein
MPAVDLELAALRDEMKNLKDSLKKAERTPAAKEYNHAPAVVQSVGKESRGLSVGRLLAWQAGGLDDSQVADDLEYVKQYRKALADTRSEIVDHNPKAIPVLLSAALMPGEVFEHDGGKVYQKALAAGVAGQPQVHADIDAVRLGHVLDDGADLLHADRAGH